MQCPRAVFFDLDDTLAESFHAPPPQTLSALALLLECMPVAIITGATLRRMREQFLSTFESHPRADQLYIFPTSGAQAYRFDAGAWEQLYDLALDEEARSRIKKVITEAVASIEALQTIPHYGEQTVDKGSQIAYTHVGVDAPKAVKDTWDPGGAIRGRLWEMLTRSLPDFEVLMGGITTIDITRAGVNKSYGVRWLSERLKLSPADMLYIGDALYPGGNDAVVIPTGIQTRSVSGPDETLVIIQEILAACGVESP